MLARLHSKAMRTHHIHHSILIMHSNYRRITMQGHSLWDRVMEALMLHRITHLTHKRMLCTLTARQPTPTLLTCIHRLLKYLLHHLVRCHHNP